MKKIILVILVTALSVLTLSRCFGSYYNIWMSPIYEDNNEIYFSVEMTENGVEKDYSYNLVVMNKDSGELTVTPNWSGMSRISNYGTYLGSGYGEYGELNNPVFYNTYTEEFFDIRNMQIVEFNNDCYQENFSNYSNNYTCNTLDNDIQIVSAFNESNILELTFSNYTLEKELLSINFPEYEYSEETDLYTEITSFNKYDDSKFGLRVSFYNKPPAQTSYYLETIVLEYTIETNTLVELFRGTEYKYFDFVKTDNHYVFHKLYTDDLYSYDIENDDLNTSINEYDSSYIGYGYWFGTVAEELSLYRYNSDLSINVVSIFDEGASKKSGPREIIRTFSNGTAMDVQSVGTTSRKDYSTYRLVDINSDDIIFTIDTNNKEFVNAVLSAY